MFNIKEYKVISLRETANPDELSLVDTAEKASQFWDLNVATAPQFDPEVEQFVVLFLNARRKVKGFQIVTKGIVDTCWAHPREVFRPAIVAMSQAIIIMHNHPGGDPTPSEADIKVTRELINAGRILKIDVLDHVVKGFNKFVSLRELGYFYC